MNYPSKRAYYENENNNNAKEPCYTIGHKDAIYTKDDESETLGIKLDSIDAEIGTETLGTTSQTLKGAVNEVKAIADSNTSQLSENTQNIAQLSNPNLLINGDFQAWQRGTSFSNLYQQYSADRWYCLRSGTGATTITKDSNGMSVTTTETAFIDQFIENSAQFKDTIMTFSACVDGVWYHISGKPSDALTLAIPKGNLLVSFNTSKNTVTCMIQLNSSAIINKCKFELGSIATPFVPRPYAEELALCKRYLYNIEVATYVRSIVYSSNYIYFWMPISTALRITPSLLVQAEGTGWRIINSSGTAQSGFTLFIQSGTYKNGIVFYVSKNSHGLTDASLVILNENNFLDSEIY